MAMFNRFLSVLQRVNLLFVGFPPAFPPLPGAQPAVGFVQAGWKVPWTMRTIYWSWYWAWLPILCMDIPWYIGYDCPYIGYYCPYMPIWYIARYTRYDWVWYYPSAPWCWYLYLQNWLTLLGRSQIFQHHGAYGLWRFVESIIHCIVKTLMILIPLCPSSWNLIDDESSVIIINYQ